MATRAVQAHTKNWGLKLIRDVVPNLKDPFSAGYHLKGGTPFPFHLFPVTSRPAVMNESMVKKWNKLENKIQQVKKTQLSFRGKKRDSSEELTISDQLGELHFKK